MPSCQCSSVLVLWCDWYLHRYLLQVLVLVLGRRRIYHWPFFTTGGVEARGLSLTFPNLKFGGATSAASGCLALRRRATEPVHLISTGIA